MRRVSAPCAVFALTAVWLAAACSSSQPSRPIGPVYGFEGGADVATDHPPDSRAPVDASPDRSTATDAPTPHDATVEADAVSPEGAAPGDARVEAPAGSDASDGAAPPVDATGCPSSATVALVGGTATGAFGAVSSGGGAWVVSSLSGPTVAAAPALVPLAGGFLGVFPTTANKVIDSVLYAPAATPTWGNAVAVPPALPGGELGAPALAVLGGSAEFVYQGSDYKFYRSVYGGSGWGASDQVGGAPPLQDYGPSAPAAAVVGTTLFVAYDGGDSVDGGAAGLYVDSWTSGGGWAGAKAVPGAGVGAVPPTLIALSGGVADLMLVYATAGLYHLYSAVHTPGGSWSTPVAVNVNAYTSTEVSVAPLAGGGAVMVYLGGDSLPYASIYAPGATPPWTAPAKVSATSPVLSSPPSVAAGVCGVDAVAALVTSSGVQVVSLTAGVWADPVPVSGTASMTYATVATTP